MTIAVLASTAALLALAAPALAQAPAQCDRTDLQHMVDGYVAAQTAGDSIKLPLADFTSYTEQGDDASMSTGMLSHPETIAFRRTLFDVPTCQAFAELIITDPARPAVIGTRMQFSGRDNPIAPSRVNQIESVITGSANTGFDVSRALATAKAEDWSEIPAAERDTRATLLAAANAYLDLLGDASAKPPLDPACTRTEGGTTGPCTAGAGGHKATERRFVVDDGLGAVAAFATLGPDKRADVHLLRIEKGRIRIVQALTAAKGE